MSQRCDEDAISIHAPHARSDGRGAVDIRALGISIHAPHARSDPLRAAGKHGGLEFQSTLLMRGATLSLIVVP